MEYKGDTWYIKSVLSGDVNAYAHLVDRYKDMVFSLAVRMVRNNEEAEEAAQDTFVKAFQSLHRFRGQAKFSTWIYKITYNTCISRLRKHKPVNYNIDEVTMPETVITDTDNGLRDLELEERRMIVNRSLQELDAEEGFLITLYYYNDKKLEEIAEITGLTKNHVKVKLFRARKRMLHLLQNYVLSE